MVACGVVRNQLKAMVRLGLSFALRTSLKNMAIILSQLTCTGPGTVLMVESTFPASASQGERAFEGSGHLGVKPVSQFSPLTL